MAVELDLSERMYSLLVSLWDTGSERTAGSSGRGREGEYQSPPISLLHSLSVASDTSAQLVFSEQNAIGMRYNYYKYIVANKVGIDYKNKTG